MPIYPPAAWQRLADVVMAQRLDLGLSQKRLADEAELSTNTIRNVENGKGVHLLTLRKIDAALGWQTGSCRAVLDGGEPTAAEPAPPRAEPPVSLPEQPQRWQTERAADMSDEEWAVVERMLDGIMRNVDDMRRRRR